jgi:anion-transporting  ArsA/GET3 family ATPase
VSAASTRVDGRLCICVGAGGVGKTTMAAAIALGRAARGERVAVITIDPAPRLARALGFEELEGEPQLVAGAGELWAMRLDPKRTLDDLIASLAPDADTRERALSNRIYRELSSAVAGAQEFSAVAKLYELDRSGSFDTIVLDTPPSRNALDFLDAPGRLMRFFDGRAIRMLVSQGGLASRVSSPVLGVLGRLTGGDVMREIMAFMTAIASMVDGLSARAAAVAALLRDPATSFVLVSSPRREAVEEAIAFAAELRRSELSLGAVVVNRMHAASDGDAELIGLDDLLGPRLGALVRASVADLTALATADHAAFEALRAAFPGLEPFVVPELPMEVHDLAGLSRVARHLGYRVSSPTEASPSVAQ